jgi:hypothetical protein
LLGLPLDLKPELSIEIIGARRGVPVSLLSPHVVMRINNVQVEFITFHDTLLGDVFNSTDNEHP